MIWPYKWEPLQGGTMKRKPHRSDMCGRCQSGDPCPGTSEVQPYENDSDSTQAICTFGGPPNVDFRRNVEILVQVVDICESFIRLMKLMDGKNSK